MSLLQAHLAERCTSISRPGCEPVPEPPSRQNLYSHTGCSAVSGFLFGYDMGATSGALLSLKESFDADSAKEAVVALALACAAMGSFVGYLANGRWGRRGAVLLASGVYVIGCILTAVSPHISVLLLGRCIVGFGIGIGMMTTPAFIAEVITAPLHESPGTLTDPKQPFLAGGTAGVKRDPDSNQ